MFDNFSIPSSLMISLMDVCCVKSGDWYEVSHSFFIPLAGMIYHPFVRVL